MTRNPTMVAPCGCPYDPVYDEDSLGWHLIENHIPERIALIRSELQHVLERVDVLETALRTRTDIYAKHDLEPAPA